MSYIYIYGFLRLLKDRLMDGWIRWLLVHFWFSVLFPAALYSAECITLFFKVFAVVLFINFQHFYAVQRYKHNLTILIYLLWKQSCVFTSRSSSPGTAKIVLRFVIQRCGRQYITAVTHQATAKVHGTFLWHAFSCCKLLTIITWISGRWPRVWFILLKCAGGKYLSAHSVTLLVGGDFLIKLC